MKDLNLCQFIGRLGADPESRFTSNDKAVTSFRIACGWKGKTGEGVEWVNCVSWGKLAEIVASYLKKGSQVYVSGRMQTRKWEDKSGSTRYSTEVVLTDMQMLGGKSGNHQKVEDRTSESYDFDDDIPF